MSVDFLGIGVQKGGTTWLYHQLSRHPQIAFPGGKELHFWNRCDPAVAAGWQEILEPPSRLTADGRPVRSGEITPAYALLPRETIAALKDACPAVRLFISLRNPLARAWSAAKMALTRAEMSEPEASDHWFIDHFRSAGSRLRGGYADCLTRWWDVFPREQLLVLFHDEIAAAPLAVLSRVARHLGVEAGDFESLPPDSLATMVVPQVGGDGAAPGGGSRPRPSLVPVLREIYADEIAQLGRLLGRDLTGWLENVAAPGPDIPAGRQPVACGGAGSRAVDALAFQHPRQPEPTARVRSN